MEDPDKTFYRTNGESPREEAGRAARSLGAFLIMCGLSLLVIAGLLTAYLW